MTTNPAVLSPVREEPTSYSVYPAGYDEAASPADKYKFVVHVTRTRDGGWVVTDESRFSQLSHDGSWQFPVHLPACDREHVRFHGLDEALTAARAGVATLTLNGRTFADWVAAAR